MRRVICIALLVLVAIWPRGSDVDPPRPDEQDAPIEVDGLHVLFLYESEDWHSMTPGQIDVIQSAQQAGELRRWLDKNAKDWACHDDDTNMEHGESWLRDAVGVHDGTVPWLLVANDDAGYVGKLPESVSETVDLLKGFDD